jgi:hypothetical protein
LGRLSGEFLRAGPPPKPKFRLAALAKRAAQPYDVVVLVCPQPPDHFARIDPCPTLSDAEANGADDEAPRASPEPEGDDTVSVVDVARSHLDLLEG